MSITVEQHRRYVEFISVLLLGAAGLGTSWSTYQASLWSGEQWTKNTAANGLLVESTRDHEAADHQSTIDVAVFSSWVNARAAGNTVLADFYRERFRAEFKPAFDTWLSRESPLRPGESSTPFDLPEYQLARDKEAAELARRANAAFDAAQLASDRSGTYILVGVLLASVLFFSGIAQQFHIPRVQTAVLGIASLLLVFGICRLCMLPRLG